MTVGASETSPMTHGSSERAVLTQAWLLQSSHQPELEFSALHLYVFFFSFFFFKKWPIVLQLLVEKKKLESLTRLKLPLYYESLGDFQLGIIM